MNIVFDAIKQQQEINKKRAKKTFEKSVLPTALLSSKTKKRTSKNTALNSLTGVCLSILIMVVTIDFIPTKNNHTNKANIIIAKKSDKPAKKITKIALREEKNKIEQKEIKNKKQKTKKSSSFAFVPQKNQTTKELKTNDISDYLLSPEYTHDKVKHVFVARLPEPPTEIASIKDENEKTIKTSEALIKIKDISPKQKDYISGGYAALMRGSFATALQLYELALFSNPKNINALLGKAVALHKLRYEERAIKLYKKVLKMSPQNKEAINNIMAILSKKSPEETLAKLVDLQKDIPNYSPIVEQIGLIYASKKKYNKALFYLKKATQINPEPIYFYNLAIVLDSMGIKKQAIYNYQRAIDPMNASNKLKTKIQKEVQQRLAFLNNKTKSE